MFIIGKRDRPRADGVQTPQRFTMSTTPAIHASMEIAEGEATRLCLANPQHEFVIFAPVTVARSTVAPVELIKM